MYVLGAPAALPELRHQPWLPCRKTDVLRGSSTLDNRLNNPGKTLRRGCLAHSRGWRESTHEAACQTSFSVGSFLARSAGQCSRRASSAPLSPCPRHESHQRPSRSPVLRTPPDRGGIFSLVDGDRNRFRFD